MQVEARESKLLRFSNFLVFFLPSGVVEELALLKILASNTVASSPYNGDQLQCRRLCQCPMFLPYVSFSMENDSPPVVEFSSIAKPSPNSGSAG